jgi:hypothetical protein
MLKYKTYCPKRTDVQAVKIDGKCTRMNMMSSVYTYEGTEFVANVMPVVGDYLMLEALGAIPKHVGQKAFEKLYTKVDG